MSPATVVPTFPADSLYLVFGEKLQAVFGAYLRGVGTCFPAFFSHSIGSFDHCCLMISRNRSSGNPSVRPNQTTIRSYRSSSRRWDQMVFWVNSTRNHGGLLLFFGDHRMGLLNTKVKELYIYIYIHTYLGKFHHDRSLFSRALESWFISGKSSPAMAQQFR